MTLSCQRALLCIGTVQVTHPTTSMRSPYLLGNEQSRSYEFLVPSVIRDTLRPGASVQVVVRVAPLLGAAFEQTFTVDVPRA